MRSLMAMLFVLSFFVGASRLGAEELYRRDPVTGAYSRVYVSAQSKTAADTTVVLTVHEGDTSKVVTIRKNDPLRGMDKSLRGIFGLQVTMVIVSIVSTVVTLVALN
jgi:hypothetical protein